MGKSVPTFIKSQSNVVEEKEQIYYRLLTLYVVAYQTNRLRITNSRFPSAREVA